MQGQKDSSDAPGKGVAPLRAAQDGAAHRPYPTATLADLYDPLATPHDLQKAHEELDRAADNC